jgi:hypothetical protein
MVAKKHAGVPASDVAIFGRLLTQHKDRMSPSLARYVLGLGFNEADQVKMEELAAANQQGVLTAEQRDELIGYVNAGHLLALLQSKARSALRKRKSS